MRIDAHDDYLENGLTIRKWRSSVNGQRKQAWMYWIFPEGNIITLALKYEVPSLDLPCGFQLIMRHIPGKETGILTS